MNSIAKILGTQAVLVDGVALKPSRTAMDDKTALQCEINCDKRLFKVTGKSRYKSKPKKQNPYEVEKFLRTLTDAQRRVTSALMIFSRLFGVVTAGAPAIARNAQCCTKTVYRTYTELISFGLIKRKRRGREGRYDNASFTFVNPILEHPLLKSRLWTLFDAYTYFKRECPRYLLLFLLFTTNVPLVYSNNISTKEYHSRDDSNSPKPSNLTPMSSTLSAEDKSLPHAKGPPMTEVPVISDILRLEVTPLLQLTKEGQFKMSAFDDGALLSALEGFQVLARGELDFDFRLFINLCERYVAKIPGAYDPDKPERLMKQFNYTPKGILYRKENWSQPANSVSPQPKPKYEPKHQYRKPTIPIKQVIPVIPMATRDILSRPEPEPANQLSINPLWANEIMALKEKMEMK